MGDERYEEEEPCAVDDMLVQLFRPLIVQAGRPDFLFGSSSMFATSSRSRVLHGTPRHR